MESQNAKESETELRALVKSLQSEVENKTHDLQVMQKSLERLRKEKQISMTYKFGDGECLDYNPKIVADYCSCLKH